MFTRSTKGQGLIGQVIAFAFAIFLSLALFMIMSGTGNITEENVEKKVDFQMNAIKERAVLTSTMEDVAWRRAYHATAQNIYNRYGNMKAYKLISYYFSTSGNHIYVDGDKIPKSTVKTDIKDYLNHKMRNHWQRGARNIDYQLKIQNYNSKGKPEVLIVNSTGYDPSGRFSRTTFSLALSGGDSAVLTMRTTGSKSMLVVN